MYEKGSLLESCKNKLNESLSLTEAKMIKHSDITDDFLKKVSGGKESYTIDFKDGSSTVLKPGEARILLKDKTTAKEIQKRGKNANDFESLINLPF